MDNWIKIKLKEVNDVHVFCAEMAKLPFNIDVKSGKFIVDAKSILGMFSLRLAEPVVLITHPDNVDKLREAVEQWIID